MPKIDTATIAALVALAQSRGIIITGDQIQELPEGTLAELRRSDEIPPAPKEMTIEVRPRKVRGPDLSKGERRAQRREQFKRIKKL